MRSFIRTTLNPAIYHGHKKRPPFFEGWYYKLVSADGHKRLAIIPGVFLGDNNHAFIQVLDGSASRADYVSFPSSEFWASDDEFRIRIGQNHFSNNEFTLNLQTSMGPINGTLSFDKPHPWPVKLFSPGIMGWYAWIPRMECYHGVVSFDHAIDGRLSLNGESIDFAGGRGYIEKDWGQAFPEGYIWFQSNHFRYHNRNIDQSKTLESEWVPGISLTASVAIIPWVGRAFRGFIVGLWMNNLLYRFATYTGAKIEKLDLTDDTVDWIIADKRYRLRMFVRRAESNTILGPTREAMGMRVDETISASVDVSLTDRNGRPLFEGKGHFAGLEVQGDLERLLKM